MNNSDMSATPTGFEVWINPKNPEEGTTECLGLTKKEAFAMAAMQGVLSNPYLMEVAMTTKGGMAKESVVTIAIDTADALLKKLEENKDE